MSSSRNSSTFVADGANFRTGADRERGARCDRSPTVSNTLPSSFTSRNVFGRMIIFKMKKKEEEEVEEEDEKDEEDEEDDDQNRDV